MQGSRWWRGTLARPCGDGTTSLGHGMHRKPEAGAGRGGAGRGGHCWRHGHRRGWCELGRAGAARWVRVSSDFCTGGGGTGVRGRGGGMARAPSQAHGVGLPMSCVSLWRGLEALCVDALGLDSFTGAPWSGIWWGAIWARLRRMERLACACTI